MRTTFILCIAWGVLATGCLAPTAISTRYDFRRIRRIGVLKFESPPQSRLGVSDIFQKYLLDQGYNVIERTKLDAIMHEQKLGQTGLISSKSAKEIGRMLGVDALIMGQVISYYPERKRIVMIETKSKIEEPIFKTKMKKLPNGSFVQVREQVGTRIRYEDKKVPQVFTIDAQVGLVGKLVDVETGEVVWVGSSTSEGVNAQIALESVVSYLVRKLRKQWNPQQARN